MSIELSDYRVLPNGERDIAPPPDRETPVAVQQIARGIYRTTAGNYLFAPAVIYDAAREALVNREQAAVILGELVRKALKAER